MLGVLNSWENVGRCYLVLRSAGAISSPARIVEEVRAFGVGIEDYILGSVAEAQAQAKPVEWALAVAEEIGDPDDKTKAFVRIAEVLATAGMAADAIAVAEEIKGPRDRIEAFGRIAEVLATAGLGADAIAASKRFMSFMESHPDAGTGTDWSRVVKALALAGNKPDWESCLSAVAAIDEGRHTSHATTEVALALAARGEMQEAERLARATLASAEDDIQVKAKLALVLAKCGRPEEAVSLAKTSSHPWIREDWQHPPDELIQALVEAGEAQLAIRAWVKAGSPDGTLPGMISALFARRPTMESTEGAAWWTRQAAGVALRQRPVVLSRIAGELERHGHRDEAMRLELHAVMGARYEDRSMVFSVLGNGAGILAAVDQGQTLLRFMKPCSTWTNGGL